MNRRVLTDVRVDPRIGARLLVGRAREDWAMESLERAEHVLQANGTELGIGGIAVKVGWGWWTWEEREDGRKRVVRCSG